MRLLRLFLVTALLLFVSPALHADTTYTYTGNPFTLVDPPFTTSDSISGYITVASPITPGSIDTFTPLDFSFSDGLQTIDPSNISYYISSFSLETDSTGAVVYWSVLLNYITPKTIAITSYLQDSVASDFATAIVSGVDGSAQNADPGTWTVTTATPEPSSIALLATGLLTAATTLRRRRHSRSNSSLRR